ncbi:unnamed protein product, partial [Didymodactylos carnosus]
YTDISNYIPPRPLRTYAPPLTSDEDVTPRLAHTKGLYKHTKNKFIRTSYAKTVHERQQTTLQPLMSVNPYDILRPPDDLEMDEMDDITSSPTEARKARLPKRNLPPHPSLRPQINNYSHRRTQSTRNIEKQSNGNNTRQ